MVIPKNSAATKSTLQFYWTCMRSSGIVVQQALKRDAAAPIKDEESGRESDYPRGTELRTTSSSYGNLNHHWSRYEESKYRTKYHPSNSTFQITRVHDTESSEITKGKLMQYLCTCRIRLVMNVMMMMMMMMMMMTMMMMDDNDDDDCVVFCFVFCIVHGSLNLDLVSLVIRLIVFCCHLLHTCLLGYP